MILNFKNSILIKIVLIILIPHPEFCIAQGIVNSDCSFVLNTGSCINLVNCGYTNLSTGNGTITNDGLIVLTGNWTNNCSNPVFINRNNTGYVEFTGNSPSAINGTGTTVFENLSINKTSSVVNVFSDISIDNYLDLNSGDLDLRNSNINLGTSGSLRFETSDNRVKATDGITDGTGTGTIFLQKILNAGNYLNIAGLGLSINAITDFGLSTIKRGHLKQQGSIPFTANYSIFRYYDVTPSAKTINYGTFSMSYFPAWELNGHLDNSLVMFQYYEDISGGPDYWKPLPTTNGSPVASAMSVISNLPSIKITLASDETPLPVVLEGFKANCNVKNVNLVWRTFSENNNNFFTIQKSKDAVTWFFLSDVIGSGNSNIINEYSLIDYEISDSSRYYKLSQTDYNGETRDIGFTSTNCFFTEDIFFDVFPNPVSENVYLQITVTEDSEINIKIFNETGMDIFNKNYRLCNGKNIIPLDVSKFSNAVYYIKANVSNQEYIKQFVVLHKN